MDRSQLPISEYSDVFTAFLASARCWSDRTALVADGGRGQSFTYGDTAANAGRLAAGLKSRHLVAPEGIGLLSENRPEWPQAYLGILGSGATVVPVDANLKTLEIARLIGHSKIRTVFCSQRFLSVLAEAAPDVLAIPFDPGGPDSWREFMDEQSADPPAVDRDDVAALIYTSGTTGEPKAVELTHGNILSNLEQIRGALYFDENDVFLSLLPLHHTFEATCGFLTPILAGAKIVFARSYKSREIVEDIRDNAATLMVGVPLLFEKMYQAFQRRLADAPLHRRALFRVLFKLSAAGWQLGVDTGRALLGSIRRKAGLDSIRLFVSGGAPLPSEVARFFNLIGFTMVQGYGLTETSPVVSVNRPGAVQFGSVGPPLPGVEARIDAPNEEGIGELVVRGDNITPGYRDNAAATAELIREGWLHTGDLARFDRGHLWITGRAKNVIVSGAGKNIYPEELEELLNSSPLVAESVVFGRKVEKKPGEKVCAIIVVDTETLVEEYGGDPDAPDLDLAKRLISDLVTNQNDSLATFKRITHYDVRFEELEKTSTRKVKRFRYQ